MGRVHAYSPDYSGPGAGGVVFQDGVAETDSPGVLAYYARKGWSVDEEPGAVRPAADDREPDEDEVGHHGDGSDDDDGADDGVTPADPPKAPRKAAQPRKG